MLFGIPHSVEGHRFNLQGVTERTFTRLFTEPLKGIPATHIVWYPQYLAVRNKDLEEYEVVIDPQPVVLPDECHKLELLLEHPIAGVEFIVDYQQQQVQVNLKRVMVDYLIRAVVMECRIFDSDADRDEYLRLARITAEVAASVE